MKRILFITANRLGDAVISSGVLAELVRRYPKARFTIACGPVATSYFEACPAVERIIVVSKKRYDLHWADLWWQCVGQWWSLVVDLRGSGVSLFLPTLRRRILRGGRRPGRRIGHLSGLFADRPALMPQAWSRPDQNSLAREILPEGQRYCALAPTANWDGKIWPAANFVVLGREMQKRGLVPVLFYGPGEAERARAQPVLVALDRAIDLGGDAALGLVTALLRRCAVFVGNDSGLMHLAAATGVPTLGLFGPSRASEYAPAGPDAHFLAAPGPEGKASIDRLSSERVVQQACALLTDEG
ncbi:glycosyltransferase family 9 protein [Asaia prunellae]|uniref:glycosyltransferase family 9 protein n=1 Tax=Asaia prunellae TaxID=610245 RepID=UPI00046F282F|nr:glycosyltransferase family 9 protein [Asaia prunellae]